MQGDIVVVSCGAANSAKLLLASASDKHPNGLANGSDQVGRNFMYHDSQAVLALSKDPNPTVFQKTLGVNDFYFRGPDFDYPMGNIQMIGKSQAAMFRGEKPLETKFAPNWALRDVAEHAVDFWLSTEDLPQPDNRVTLGPDGGVHLAYTPSNPTAAKRLFHQLHSMLGSLRMQPGHLAHRFAYMKTDIPVAGCAHQAGTVRFGSTRPRRCSTPTAGPTKSTTSTSLTPASSRASARSTRPSPRWPTPSGSATTCCNDSPKRKPRAMSATRAAWPPNPSTPDPGAGGHAFSRSATSDPYVLQKLLQASGTTRLVWVRRGHPPGSWTGAMGSRRTTARVHQRNAGGTDTQCVRRAVSLYRRAATDTPAG